MDELKNTEKRNDAKTSAGWPFSEELTEAWERLEKRTWFALCSLQNM
jgi:hypothetical protein